jgi:hypothetical protein
LLSTDFLAEDRSGMGHDSHVNIASPVAKDLALLERRALADGFQAK